MDIFFKFATPIVYWILIIVWAAISIFYFKKIRLLKGYGKFLKLLLIILAIDAARTFFESLYFGAWYTSYSGLLPIGLYNFLANPKIVFIPKIINLIIALLILFLIIKKWLKYELVEINETFDKQGFEIKKLSAAVNQSANSIVITDLKGDIEYTNPKFTEITGYTAEEVLGKNPRILNSGEHSKEFYSNMWKIISTGEIWSSEFKNKKKNGEFYWEDVTMSPIKNDAGEIVNYLAIKKDISELKEKNIELSQLGDKLAKKNRQIFDSKNKFKKLFDKSPVSIMEQDFSEAIKLLNKKKAETNDIKTYLNENLSFVKKCVSKIEVINVNEITLSLLGVKNLEELKIHFIKTNTEKSFISLKNELVSIALGKKDFYGETEFIKSDGTILHAMIKSTMIDDKGKNIASIVDITGITKAQEELIIAKEKAEESDKLKSAFLANMSHEIRTPMNGILGFSELLKSPNLSGEKQDKYLEIIEKSGKRMLNVINDIVDISKIEAGLMNMDIKECNINEQIEYIHTFFKPEAENKGIQLSFKNTLPSKETFIKTDKEKLLAILTNLVKNAVKYTEKGSIEFGYEKKGDYLNFFIKDTGIGIPKERQKAIFERFIQADIKDKMARQGAGLGLSITKAYIEMLGGKIWVESEEGCGSTFYFTLPCNVELKEKNSTKEIEVTNNTENNSINLKILIAEDDEVSEILISTYVSEFSNNIVKATTGIEAIEICQNNPDIDLILMDIQMPEMNGLEATRKIRKFNKDVIIIAQTAYGLTGDREKSLDAGCDDYITKPIKKSKLDLLIQKYFTLR